MTPHERAAAIVCEFTARIEQWGPPEEMNEVYADLTKAIAAAITEASLDAKPPQTDKRPSE